MGFLATEPSQAVDVVTTLAGKVTVRGYRHPKARVWLLADRTMVVVLPAPSGKGVVRNVERVTVSEFNPRTKMLTAVLEDDGALTVDGKGCGCNMGAVANAGPVEGRYEITRVRTPEWHEVLR